jgi:hypothetical protein
VLFVGVFCGSDLFTGICPFVCYTVHCFLLVIYLQACVHLCVVLYIVFGYAVLSSLHITSF